MRIAVNTRFLIPGQMEGYGYFTQEVFLLLAQTHPHHQFIFFFDQPFDAGIVFPSNVTPVVLLPKAEHAISFRWWFDVKIPLALKKYKADVFVSPDGFCSLLTSVPQVLVTHYLAFLHYPKFTPKNRRLFFKRYTPKFLKKASVIATLSDYAKNDIIETYSIPPEKVLVVHAAAKSIFKPVEWDERQEIKEQYADGCEYFVFVGGIHPLKNVLNLLKAFSLFKKRQQSNMKLIIAGRMAWDLDEVTEKMKTFKYRHDVKITGYLPEEKLIKVVAGAYAMVYPVYLQGFGVPILEAMQCDVPVITSNTSSLPEVGGEAALYADPANAAEIADKMKMIYTNENIRTQLVEKGRENVLKYSWQKTAELMWQAIEKAVSK